MRGPTLPFALTRTYGPISIDLIEKRKTFFFFLSLSPLTLCLFSRLSSPSFLYFPSLFFFLFFSFLYLFLFLFWTHGSHCTMCPSLIQVRFYLETIYFFSVQFILTELISINFLTSEIFVKISSLKSLATYHSENHKNIPIVSDLTKLF